MTAQLALHEIKKLNAYVRIDQTGTVQRPLPSPERFDSIDSLHQPRVSAFDGSDVQWLFASVQTFDLSRDFALFVRKLRFHSATDASHENVVSRETATPFFSTS